MRLYVCSVRDRATSSYGNPMCVVAVGAALRGFSDEANRKDSEIGKHPEDYDLYKLGEFDTDTGLFDCGVPEQIAIGKNCIVSV